MKADLILGLGLRGLGAISSFALAWIIAQMFGARTVGLYQIGFTTATLLGTIALLSQDVVVVREVAPLLKDDRRGEAVRRFWGARRLVFIVGGALAALAVLIAFPLSHYGLNELDAAPFIIALAPAVLLLALMRTHNALLRCMGKVKLSQTLEGVSYTTLAMISLALLWQFAPGTDPLAAPILLLFGLSLSVATGYWATTRAMSDWPREGEAIRPDIRAGTWIAAGPILAQAGNWLVLLIITAWMGAADGGIFRIAVLICTLMQLVNTSFATMAGPYLSRAADSGDIGQVRRVILTAGAIGVGISAPVALLALLAPEWIMGLFGQEFVRGAGVLQWLAVSQLINVAAGPVGVALIMRKRERTVLAVEACATATMLALAVALVPQIGLTGAGVALVASALLRNGANWLFNWFGSVSAADHPEKGDPV